MKSRWIKIAAGSFVILAAVFVVGFTATTQTATMGVNLANSPHNSINPATALKLTSKQLSVARMHISYSPITHHFSANLSYSGGDLKLTPSSIQESTVSTHYGNVNYLLVSGTLSNGVSVLIDTQFVPGIPHDSEAVMTVEGVGQPVHIAMGTAFLNLSTLKQLQHAKPNYQFSRKGG